MADQRNLSALPLAARECWCCHSEFQPRDPDPWEGRMDGYCEPCSWARCDTTDSSCPRVPVSEPTGEDDQEFLLRLQRIANDWRSSDEFIGIVVRTRFPAVYGND